MPRCCPRGPASPAGFSSRQRVGGIPHHSSSRPGRGPVPSGVRHAVRPHLCRWDGEVHGRLRSGRGPGPRGLRARACRLTPRSHRPAAPDLRELKDKAGAPRGSASSSVPPPTPLPPSPTPPPAVSRPARAHRGGDARRSGSPYPTRSHAARVGVGKKSRHRLSCPTPYRLTNHNGCRQVENRNTKEAVGFRRQIQDQADR